jgi:proline iminopeptidase
MMILGSQRFYRRYYPQTLREHSEIVFCDLRQWAPTPDGFDVKTITRDTFSEDAEALREATGLDRPIVAGQSQHGAHALLYAYRYPDRVRGVLPIAATPSAGSRDGLESSEDFWQRDAGADRLAAHRHNQATRRVPASIETRQDFIDAYVADEATVWYDYNFNSSP